MNWATHLLSFYRNLHPPKKLPKDIGWLYPQQQQEVMQVVEEFCRTFYEDTNSRTVILGINPGRFGAGVTGVNFTAPKQLSLYCGIGHSFRPQTELSAEFIYEVIQAYGGARSFYADFFIGSVCPLGFVQHGKNLNYYDDRELLQTVEPFIIESMERLLSYRVDRSRCICIGGEKNYKHLSYLNNKHGWFEQVFSLPHPRFIMQYRRKIKDQFIQEYLQLMSKA
jgi:hypothetical protein